MEGKGSKARPFSVDKNTFDSNWENIFRKKEKVNGQEQSQQSNADQDRKTTSRTTESNSTD
jgi:hypothetical protein